MLAVLLCIYVKKLDPPPSPSPSPPPPPPPPPPLPPPPLRTYNRG